MPRKYIRKAPFRLPTVRFRLGSREKVVGRRFMRCLRRSSAGFGGTDAGLWAAPRRVPSLGAVSRRKIPYMFLCIPGLVFTTECAEAACADTEAHRRLLFCPFRSGASRFGVFRGWFLPRNAQKPLARTRKHTEDCFFALSVPAPAVSVSSVVGFYHGMRRSRLRGHGSTPKIAFLPFPFRRQPFRCLPWLVFTTECAEAACADTEAHRRLLFCPFRSGASRFGVFRGWFLPRNAQKPLARTRKHTEATWRPCQFF